MSEYTDPQRKALHVWCQKCANTLNENQMWYHSPLNPNKVLPWTKMRFKNAIYKEYLSTVLNKTSTEQQDSVDPSEVYLGISGHIAAEYGVQLPEWPSNRWTMNTYTVHLIIIGKNQRLPLAITTKAKCVSDAVELACAGMSGVFDLCGVVRLWISTLEFGMVINIT